MQHWLFDYDLTLYGHDEKQVLDTLDRNITRFIMERFGTSEPEADALRREYWRDHGTTLNGLRATRGIGPTEYFDFIHDGENLVMPRFSPKKRDMLLSLPGRRWVFTNARRDWAERGLRSIGILDCFEGIFDIECFGWRSKPDRAVYLEVEQRLGAHGNDLTLIDDRPANLHTARHCGWRTVLVDPDTETVADDCDLRIRDVLELGATWRRL